MKLISTILALVCFSASGQMFRWETQKPMKANTLPEKDTVKVILLICDTSKPAEVSETYRDSTKNGRLAEIGYKINPAFIEWHDGKVKWVVGYSVRNRHNNVEGRIDPYFDQGFTYQEYMVHSYFLTSEKKPIPSSWIIWMAK